MRAPTQKRLLAAFRDLTPAQARLIRALCHAADDCDVLQTLIGAKCPSTDQYARSLRSDGYASRMWRRTLVLHAVNAILGMHGVYGLGAPESIRGAPPFEYLNAGDTYSTTLVYHRDPDALRIGCWGDIAERLPADAL